MTDKEIMQQALDALELLARYESPLTRWQIRKRKGDPLVTIHPHQVAANAAAVLRERLAQSEQHGQRQWVGLTNEERDECIQWAIDLDSTTYSNSLARAIEAKLKEKNA